MRALPVPGSLEECDGVHISVELDQSILNEQQTILSNMFLAWFVSLQLFRFEPSHHRSVNFASIWSPALVVSGQLTHISGTSMLSGIVCYWKCWSQNARSVSFPLPESFTFTPAAKHHGGRSMGRGARLTQKELDTQKQKLVLSFEVQ